MKANLVATSDVFDLALLQCDGLNLPPLPLEIVKPPVESPVVVVSHQLSSGLSAASSSVRGSIIAHPQSSLERLLIYNVDGGFGSVGGPVCNEAGNVVALHSKNLSVLARSYGGGVPTAAFALFLQKSIPTYRAGGSGDSGQSWKDLAENAQKSSVSILAIARTQDVGLAKRIGTGFLEDCSCCACKSFGTEDCPERACKRGKVPSVHREPTYFDTIAGKQMYAESHIMVPCTQCGGRGVVRCSFCGGSGIDPELLVRPASRLNRGYAIGDNSGNKAANALGRGQ